MRTLQHRASHQASARLCLERQLCPSVMPFSSCQNNRATGRRLPPCRITNTETELYKQAGLNMQHEVDPKSIQIDAYAFEHPEEGPLEKRVRRFFLDAILDDDVSIDDTNFWFRTPQGGWQPPVEVQFAEEAPVSLADAFLGPATASRADFVAWQSQSAEDAPAIQLADSQAPEELDEHIPRFSINELQEGEVLCGLITDIWLYHGILVDFGCEFSGLVWLEEEHWKQIDQENAPLYPGDIIEVKVHKLRQPGLYRFPIQLVPVDPALAACIPDPEHYSPTINHGWAADQGWTMEQIAAATGRTYEEMKYFAMPHDADMAHEIQRAYGWDDDFLDIPLVNQWEEEWTENRHDEIEAAAASID